MAHYTLNVEGFNYIPDGGGDEVRVERPADSSPVDLSAMPKRALKVLLEQGCLTEAEPPMSPQRPKRKG